MPSGAQLIRRGGGQGTRELGEVDAKGAFQRPERDADQLGNITGENGVKAIRGQRHLEPAGVGWGGHV